MWGEGRGEQQSGDGGEHSMRAVGHTIRNRVNENRKRYGVGWLGVIHKRKQYSCWNRNDRNRGNILAVPSLPYDHPERVAWRLAYRLAGPILSGEDPDNTGGATFYHTETTSPYWRRDMRPIGVMFGHIFYKPLRAGEHND